MNPGPNFHKNFLTKYDSFLEFPRCRARLSLAMPRGLSRQDRGNMPGNLAEVRSQDVLKPGNIFYFVSIPSIIGDGKCFSRKSNI
jgi:hypothetical protein